MTADWGPESLDTGPELTGGAILASLAGDIYPGTSEEGGPTYRSRRRWDS